MAGKHPDRWHPTTFGWHAKTAIEKKLQKSGRLAHSTGGSF